MKDNLHPLNKHKSGYDFELLTQSCPGLTPFVISNKTGKPTINFSDQEAVKWLNKALLKAHYQINYWDIPRNYLIPPVPGRVDYIHYVADLLKSSGEGTIPTGPNIWVLDIGTGANCIYPLLGNSIYGWRFVGSDIDQTALKNAKQIINKNQGLSDFINIRVQKNKNHFFRGILNKDEYFDLMMCNPPYHASEEEATFANQRKNRNLGIATKDTVLRNFGGQNQELWTKGGELSFVRNIITESKEFGSQIFWFSSILSKKDHLPVVERHLKKMEAKGVHILKMAQGQKIGRIIAWTFLSEKQQKNWSNYRW